LSTGIIVILVVLGILLLVGGGFFLYQRRRKVEDAILNDSEVNDEEDPTVELLKKVRKIEIKTKGISRHIFSGEYHSAFKGRGMSFSEVRSYQYGDDVRNIDWNVTARTGDPYVKIFEEERELTVMLLIDMSRSAFFGTKNQFKNEILTEICAILAFSAINNNDKVGVIFFSNKIEKIYSA
jgi:LPXTG-motif cell wall-anchored protein